MNKQEADILNTILQQPFINQRLLSETSGHSLGVVNRSIKNLIKEDWLDELIRPTSAAYKLSKDKSPQNAIILAAGFGMRMVPINTQIPKALIEINGEPLVERIIRQLHEVGIKDISIVVGFMKEQFEYLIDEYDVNLIVNESYIEKNNLHSLALAATLLGNTYIIPCDIWCSRNPFRCRELYAWYMVSDNMDDVSSVRVNRKKDLIKSKGGNSMIGIAYLTKKYSKLLKEKLIQFDKSSTHNNDFWEDALIDGDRMMIQARVVRASEIVDINTYEQLRELDEDSNHLKTDAITIITNALGVNQRDIVDIEVLKKGMTNRSFLFCCRGKRYIMRIPGEGTNKLINRQEEAEVYRVLLNRNICDDIIYINPQNGYKITSFLENSHSCNPNNPNDLRACMDKLKSFHNLKLKVSHEFDIFEQIDFYESLWDGNKSIFRDYYKTKKHIFNLKHFIDKNVEEKVLTHIDAVPDNFLFTASGDIRLIDWEYAGMQDPHVDVAMFCIYALYDRKQVDNLINIYFDNACSHRIRLKIYCYIAACGLLWSNWCEYKRGLGIEFGEYSLRQYRYAKEYYKIVQEELSKYA